MTDLTKSLPKLSKLEPTFKHFKHKPLKDIESKLLRYEHARSTLEKKAQNDHMTEVNMLKSMQQTKRQDAMKNLKENQTFMKQWFAEGKKNWQSNQDIRAKEMMRQQYFEDREISIYK